VRYSPEVGFAIPDLQRDLEKAARRDLDAAITDDDRRTLKVVGVVQTSFNVPGGVTEYAKNNAIDLIIVGTHGRGAVKQLLLGSAAEKVVRLAPCPVLTVRARERDFIAPDSLAPTTAKACPLPTRPARFSPMIFPGRRSMSPPSAGRKYSAGRARTAC